MPLLLCLPSHAFTEVAVGALLMLWLFPVLGAWE